MTPESQRIAIAEACGWLKMIPMGKEVYYDPEGGHVFRNELPDYINDLNAMHETEKTMDDAQFDSYSRILHSMLFRGRAGRDVMCATGSQRAEAFLKALNLWK